jgi:hypothetical protein
MEMTRQKMLLIATAAVNEVMDANQAEKGNTWIDISPRTHLRHSVINSEDAEILMQLKVTENVKQRMAHALTRLMMAYALQFGDDYPHVILQTTTEELSKIVSQEEVLDTVRQLENGAEE